MSSSKKSAFRIAPLTSFSSNRYAAFGLESIGGYQPAKLRIYDDLIRSGAIDSSSSRTVRATERTRGKGPK